MKEFKPVDAPVVTTDGEWSTVQVPGGQLGETAGLLLDVVGVGQLKTVTHLPPGLAFKMPSAHADAVHQALFGAPVDDGQDDGGGEDGTQGDGDGEGQADDAQDDPQEGPDTPQGDDDTQGDGDGEGQADDAQDDPQEVPDTPQGDDDTQEGETPQAPAGNASKATWATFLESQGMTYPEDATRDDMVAIWGESQEG